MRKVIALIMLSNLFIEYGFAAQVDSYKAIWCD